MIHLKMLLSCFLLPLMLGAADLIHLKPDFSGSGWSDVLTATGEVTAEKGTLILPENSSVLTQRFDLPEGEIRVAGSCSGAPVIRLRFIRGGDYRNGGTELSVKEFNTKTGNISFSFPSSDAPAGSDGFRLEIANESNKPVRLKTLALKLAADGSVLNGDPFFRNELGRDHWLVSSGDSRVLKSGGHMEGNLLEMTDAGVVTTPRFSYDGERLVIGAWMAQEELKKGEGQPDWAYGIVQVIQFDRTGKEIGHVDLTPINAGSTPWRYYSLVVEAGSWSRMTESFAVVSNMCHGVTGKFRVGALSVVRQGEAAKRPPYNDAAGRVSIGVDKPGGVFNPVWQSVDMSYSSDIAHPSMQYALAELRKAGVRNLRLREFMQGQSLVKSIAQDGSFELDFSRLDSTFDHVVRDLGFQLTVTVETTPNQLSVKPGPDDHTYAHYYPPRNLKIWGEILKTVVNHWIDRYGKEAVSNWTFECWNEPNSSYFFKGTEAEFAELFGTYLEVLTAVRKERDVKFRIGTMSAFEPTPWFFSSFDKAQAIGKLNDIDVISFHIYAGFISSLDNFSSYTDRMHRIVSEYPPMAERPFYITEYNANTMNDAKLDTAANAAFAVTVNRIFLDEGIGRAYFFAACDHLWTESGRHYEGGLGLFTKTAIPKPAFNGIVLLNRFENCLRLPFQSANEPFDGIAGITPDGKDVKVLISTFDEKQPGSTEKTKLRLELDWTGRSRDIGIEMTRVDSVRANSFCAFGKVDSPSIAQQPDVTAFRKANELKPEKLTEFRFVNGKLVIELEPELNSLCYLSIFSR